MTSPPCPEDSELRAFLQGTSTTDGIATHINECLRCQSRLDELSSGSVFEEEAAANLREAAVDDATRIAQALDEIKASGEQDSSDEVAFPPGFLGPSDYPGAIGRLGQYEMLQLLGRGGMGAVFKAYDPSLHRIVAIKLLAPHLAHNPQARKRFIREAQAAAAVSHDHVVTTHAIDESAEQPAIVMQYVSGRSLQQKLDSDGALELKEILRIGLQTAAGLAAAHAQGLVHRDVKPANILLENGVQRVKLTDFGLARTVDDYGLTASGVIAGTPQYMAPEQAQGETITARADLFSLGSVMYVMCTGHSPFRASTTMGVLKNVCDATPRPIRDLNPEVPDWLCAIIDRLLAKDPARRFATAKEVAELLEQWLAHVQRPLSVPVPGALAPLPAPAPASLEPGSEAEDDDEESPVRLGRTPDEKQLLQRAVGYVELPGFALMGVGGFSLIALWVTTDWQTTSLWGNGWPSGGLGLRSGALELFQTGGPLLQTAAFIVMIIAGTRLPRLQSRTLGGVGAVLSNMTATLPVPGILGVAVGVWVLMTLLRSDVIEGFHLATELRRLKREQQEATRPGPPTDAPSASTTDPTHVDATTILPAADSVATVRDQLRGPAWGLMLLGGVGLLVTLAVYVAFVHSVGTELIACRPNAWSLGLPAVVSLLAVFGVGFAAMLLAGRRMTTLQSYGCTMFGSVSAMLVTPTNIVGLPLGIWSLVVLRRQPTRDAFAAEREVERTSPTTAAGLMLIHERLRDPAVALFLTGLLNGLLLLVLALITLQAGLLHEYAYGVLMAPLLPWLITLGLLFAVTSGVTMAAGLFMLRLRSYPVVLAGAGCAAVSLPGILVGLPVAAWVLITLIQPEVRAAFAAVAANPRNPGRRPWILRHWRSRPLLTALSLVLAGLLLLHFGGLSRTPSPYVDRAKLAERYALGGETPLPPPRFTLSRPDETLPIGREDVRQLVVSAGGARMAVAGGSEGSGFLKIWDAQTLRELALQSTPQTIHCVASGDHGQVLATGDANGKVCIRDGASGVVLWEIDAHAGPVAALAFSPADDSLVSGGEDGSLRLWKNRKSEPVDLPGLTAPATDIAITRDGSRIAAASRDRTVRFWDAAGQPTGQLTFPTVPLRISLEEPDEQLGVALEDGTVQILSLQDKLLRATWSLSGSRPTSLRAAYWMLPRAAVFVTAADDGGIRLHDFTEFRQCVTLKSPAPALGADLIGAQDRIVSAHSDGQLRIWNLNRP